MSVVCESLTILDGSLSGVCHCRKTICSVRSLWPSSGRSRLRLVGGAAQLPHWARGSRQVGAVVGAQAVSGGALQVAVLKHVTCYMGGQGGGDV